jgi:hypothetical protein
MSSGSNPVQVPLRWPIELGRACFMSIAPCNVFEWLYYVRRSLAVHDGGSILD